MSRVNGNVDPFTVQRTQIPDFDISWAGERPWPWEPGYCFGSEDGKVLFTDAHGTKTAFEDELAPSGEAVNGVAFAGDLMAVSTRSDIAFCKQRPNESYHQRAIFPGGAHDVVATPSGKIVAPMGRRGILVAGPIDGDGLRTMTLRPADEAMDFYRVIGLGGPGRWELLACAARRSGFATLPLDPDAPDDLGKKLMPPGVDFVDVAPMGVEGHPFAVAALGSECSIHFVRDVYDAVAAKTLRFSSLKDRAYRIFCTDGHVILLTDRGVYAFVGLASQFLKGEVADGPVRPRGLLMEAVDASLLSDGSLLVVLTDSFCRIGIDELVADREAGGPSRTASQNVWVEELPPPDVMAGPWVPSGGVARGQEQTLRMVSSA